jgi:hypothetical protein
VLVLHDDREHSVTHAQPVFAAGTGVA